MPNCYPQRIILKQSFHFLSSMLAWNIQACYDLQRHSFLYTLKKYPKKLHIIEREDKYKAQPSFLLLYLITCPLSYVLLCDGISTANVKTWDILIAFDHHHYYHQHRHDCIIVHITCPWTDRPKGP